MTSLFDSMPESFSDPRDEHLATRRAAGLFDFSFMGVYEFSGESSFQVLRRLQSRRLADVEPGRLAYTLLLNDDGTVFNDATVWRTAPDRWWLFTGRRSDIDRMGGAALDRSGEHAILALQGPSSGAILARLLGAGAVRGLRYFRFLATDSMVVARLGYSGELGYELMVPADEGSRLRQALLEAGREAGIRECGFAAADSLRIESGYRLFGREIDGRANPRELGLERLVDDAPAFGFSVSRRLVGLEIVPRAAHADLSQAHVTSECFSPTLGKEIALGFAAPEASPGSSVRLADGRLARVVPLPFYDPERRLPRGVPV